MEDFNDSDDELLVEDLDSNGNVANEDAIRILTLTNIIETLV